VSKNVFEKWQGVFENRKTEKKQAEVQVDESSQLGPVSRRKMLQYLGIQAVIGASVVKGAVAAPKNFNPKHYNRGITPDQLPNTRAWLVTNPNACVGCRTCEIVCSLSHEGVCQPSLSRITTTYDPTGTLAKFAAMADVCRQCNMADCYLACAYDALVLDKETGARIIDPTNRRAVRLFLTMKGDNAIPILHRINHEWETITSSSLTKEEMAQLHNLIRRMAENSFLILQKDGDTGDAGE